jgi:hypothetical protein
MWPHCQSIVRKQLTNAGFVVSQPPVDKTHVAFVISKNETDKTFEVLFSDLKKDPTVDQKLKRILELYCENTRKIPE